MVVMRKFIIDLKSDGTMKWAEVCDEPEPQKDAYKKILHYCEAMMRLYTAPSDKDRYESYYKIAVLCKNLGKLW